MLEINNAIYSPVKNPQKPLLLLLHGYGSNEHDLPGLAQVLTVELDYVSLQAPYQIQDGYPAYAWFLDPVPMRSARESLAKKSSDAIIRWLDREIAAGRIDANRKIIVLGFSQGGAMTSYLVYSNALGIRLKAAVILSGYLPFETDGDKPFSDTLPIFHGWGDADDIVEPAESIRAKQWLETNCPKTTDICYSNLAHSISLDEVNDISNFISGIL